MTTKDFSIGCVISVTSGKLLAEFSEVHELIEWMAGEPVWTHQIPRVSEEATPHLTAQYPALADVVVPDGLDTWDKVRAFLAGISPVLGERLSVESLPTVDHTSIDPLSELGLMGVSPDRVIVANLEGDER